MSTITSTFNYRRLPTRHPTPRKYPLKVDTQDESVQQALAVANKYRLRDGGNASVAIANNYLVSASCIAIVEWASGASQMPVIGSKALCLLSTCIIASRMRAMENLVNEASPNNPFVSAPLHQRFQFLYAFSVLRILEDYRRSHIVHHRHLGDPQKDPDAVRLHNLGLDRLPKKPVWYLLGLPMIGYLTYEHLATTFRDFWGSPSSRWRKSVFGVAIMLDVW